MFSTIKADLSAKVARYSLSNSLASYLRILLSDGTTAQLIYRAMRFCQKRRLYPLAFLLYRWNAMISSVLIGRDAEFGPGFILLHSFGVVVNSEVRAGRNLVLEHGVTIGAEKGKSPTLGDNVFVGAGASIVGAVRVGSDVKIGANAVVVTDIPDGATAVGVPARVVRIYGQPIAKTPTPAPKRKSMRRVSCSSTRRMRSSWRRRFSLR